jgi:cation diffusion facilitator CzcD-associated flavoprotein CzcO
MTIEHVLEKPSIVDLMSRAERSLAALEVAIARDLEILEYPSKNWMPVIKGPSGEHVYDVVVVGGGHCGVTAAFALMRERITNVLVLDKNPVGREGPWQSYARMPDLRTRKAVTGNELGYSNLTFRSYFEAREGAEAYKKLQRISCDEWTCYLLWLRRILSIPVENDCEVVKIDPEGKLFRLDLSRSGQRDAIYARRVLLTSGPLSMGGSVIPDVIRDNLSPTQYAPAYDDFDVDRFQGKRVVVVGGGASAFDNAGALLEAGAAQVDLLIRRPKIPPVSVIRWTDWSGFLQTYADLSDEQKWTLMHQVQRNASPPTLRALQRVEGWDNFNIHFGSPLLAAGSEGGEVWIKTPKETIRTDFVVLATGFTFDLRCNPALASFADHIALWQDRYMPPGGGGSEKYRKSPYLGRNYEFIEKSPGAAPFLKHIYCYNQSSTLSMGPTGRVSGLKYGVKRLMTGIVGSFVREDYEHHLATVKAFRSSELEGHPWTGEA